MRTTVLACLALALFGCGGTDLSTGLSEDALDSETELGEGTSELASSAARTWFPMSEGDEWVLASGTSKLTVKVDAASGALRHVTGLNIGTEGLWLGFSSSSPNSLYAYNEDLNQWGPFVRFGYASTPWKFETRNGGCDTFSAKRTQTGSSVVTPAGTFGDSRTIGFDLRPGPMVMCAAPTFKSITFIPSVGPVQIVSGAGEVFKLVSAKVGSKRFPASPAGTVSAKVTSDKTLYRNVPNSIRCITTPCPSNEVTARATFNLTVTNGTSSTKAYEFSSGQQFDFQIFDSAGRLVKSWSNDRMFTLAFTYVSIPAGGSKTFTGEVDLRDSNGLQLRGSYTVTGLLLPSGGGGASASTSFKVELN